MPSFYLVLIQSEQRAMGENKAPDLLCIPDYLLDYAGTKALVKQVRIKKHLNSVFLKYSYKP